ADWRDARRGDQARMGARRSVDHLSRGYDYGDSGGGKGVRKGWLSADSALAGPRPRVCGRCERPLPNGRGSVLAIASATINSLNRKPDSRNFWNAASITG